MGMTKWVCGLCKVPTHLDGLDCIVGWCSACVHASTKREVNKRFRELDQSHLFPIEGAFNVTERAIRRIRRRQREGLVVPDGGLEYILMLDEDIGNIVNNPHL